MFVRRSKYDALERQNTTLIAHVSELAGKLSVAESELVAMKEPMAQVQQEIALVEKRIELADAEAKLRKLREDPEPEQPQRPTLAKVLKVADQVYQSKKAERTKK